MKLTTLIACASALLLAVPARAAEDDVQQLKRQLQQMQDDFEKTRRQQQQQIDALTRKLDELTGQSPATAAAKANPRSEEHTSELQSPDHLVCRLLLEKKKPSLRSTLCN